MSEQTGLSRLFMIGPMGSGKSTVGRHLADLLGYVFIDSDTEIEKRAGANIPWIFDVEGEEGFRRRERDVIDELTGMAGIVLATGGGVVTQEENRRHLHERGCVVYLWTPVEVQLARTRNDRNRPLLQVDDPRARVRELHGLRDPLYREVADFIAESGQGSPLSIVRKLEREYLNRCAA